MSPTSVMNYRHHRLAEVILVVCFARTDDWEAIVSKYGVLRATRNNCHPTITGWEDLPTE